MTLMKERAVNMIERIPDDKLYYVVQLLESIDVLTQETGTGLKTSEQEAYEDLQKYRRYSDTDIDYKAELAKAREKKYADID